VHVDDPLSTALCSFVSSRVFWVGVVAVVVARGGVVDRLERDVRSSDGELFRAEVAGVAVETEAAGSGSCGAPSVACDPRDNPLDRVCA
jgi:hypothetical protein